VIAEGARRQEQLRAVADREDGLPRVEEGLGELHRLRMRAQLVR